MNLKASLFNKSIIKSDLKRLWWISALESLFVAMLCFSEYDWLTNHYRMDTAIWNDSRRYLESFLLSNMQPLLIGQLIVGIICAVLVFGYLNKNSSVSFMHSLPVGRIKLYLSHILSVAILLIIPIIMCILILLVMRQNAVVGEIISVKHIFCFAIHSSVYAALSAGVATFASMIAGNMISAFGLSGVFMLLPLYLNLIVITLFEEFLYGYWPGNKSMAEWLYRDGYDVTPGYLIMLFVIAIVLFVLSMWFYKRRKLENYGEIIAFAKLKPIFTFGVALCAGFLGYLYFASLTLKHLLLLLPFGIIGIIIAHMLMKRQFTLRGVHKPIIIYSVFILLVYGGFKTDITGFERRVPAIENIISTEVLVNEGYSYRQLDLQNYEDQFKTQIVNQEDIKKVTAMHQYAIEKHNAGGWHITIIYNLKNGKRLVRVYYFGEETDKAVLEPVMMLHQLKAKKFPIIDGTKKDNITFEIRDYRIPGGNSVTNPDDCKKIEEALARDIELLDYDNYFANPLDATLNITMEYRKEFSRFANTNNNGELSYNRLSETYIIRPDYTNTIAVLNELGLMPKPRPVEDIKQIVLYNINEVKYNYNSYGERSSVTGTEKETTIEDREQIEEIYEFIKNTSVTGPRNKSGDRYAIEIQYTDEIVLQVEYMPVVIPPEIMKYFE